MKKKKLCTLKNANPQILTYYRDQQQDSHRANNDL